MHLFIELSIIIGIAAVMSLLMRLLKQPLIVGYILTGIVCGRYFLNILTSTDEVEVFSKIGIAILLFILGLNLSPRVIREVGKVSILGGIGQIIFTSIIGFIIAILLGIPQIAALYIAIALTFSSTIIVLKLLSDKRDLTKLYGKIAIGFLLVQDIVASLILLAISSFSQSHGTNLVDAAATIILKAVGIFLMLYLFNRFVMPYVSRYAATSQEMLFLFSLAWGLGLSTLFYLFGFSIEIGALIAGVALSLTPFSYEIASRLKPLRDFFIILFFILLGSQMVLGNLGNLFVPALVLSIFVLIGNPLIAIIIMNLLGFQRKTGYLAGITVAQISEFSLILATLGFNLGQLSSEMLSLITLVGLITIAGSSYLILYGESLYPHIEPYLRFIEFNKRSKRTAKDEIHPDILLFGFGRVGRHYVHAFRALKKNFLVIDYNPMSIAKLQQEHIPHLYGDADDIEFVQELGLPHIKMMVSTMPDFKTNMGLIQKVRGVNNDAIVIVVSHTVKEAKEFYKAGATYVIMPHYLGAQYAVQMIEEHGFDKTKFDDARGIHMAHLNFEHFVQG